LVRLLAGYIFIPKITGGGCAKRMAKSAVLLVDEDFLHEPRLNVQKPK
jgi:hypothetical protein